MRRLFTLFSRNAKGAAAIEYGLVAALISVAIMAGLTDVGDKVANTFTRLWCTNCWPGG
ncbi:MAG: Flp family type IVb pilin [Phyllobacteriaceae bacterium]|nr:Flp family type IVb pilin [Phyllobacteriaceae bacterium]MBA92621.1 Flp family type IVb pilin [Phyllobacteriaceae bacterium]